MKPMLFLALALFGTGCSKAPAQTHTAVPAAPVKTAPKPVWIYSETKDPITDVVFYEETAANAQGQTLGLACNDHYLFLMLRDPRIIKRLAVEDQVLIRVGKDKANDYSMLPANGVLVARSSQKLNQPRPTAANVDEFMMAVGVEAIYAELTDQEPRLLARYRQGEDNVEFAFDVPGSREAVAKIRKACAVGRSVP